MSSAPIVWVDCEMTGPDLENDALIEVSCVVTDDQLVALDEGIDVVIKPPAHTLTDMDEVVVTMHTESGLLDELDAGVSLEGSGGETAGLRQKPRPEPRKAPLAGRACTWTAPISAGYAGHSPRHLHYRIVDVSSIKELVRRWYPRAYFASPNKRGGHRALADILDSINELRYYREAVFVPAPGPNSEDAKAITDALDSERPSEQPVDSVTDRGLALHHVPLATRGRHRPRSAREPFHHDGHTQAGSPRSRRRPCTATAPLQLLQHPADHDGTRGTEGVAHGGDCPPLGSSARPRRRDRAGTAGTRRRRPRRTRRRRHRRESTPRPGDRPLGGLLPGRQHDHRIDAAGGR